MNGGANVSVPTDADIYKRHIPADFDAPVGTKVEVTYAQARLQHTDTPTVGYRMLNIFLQESSTVSVPVPIPVSVSDGACGQCDRRSGGTGSLFA